MRFELRFKVNLVSQTYCQLQQLLIIALLNIGEVYFSGSFFLKVISRNKPAQLRNGAFLVSTGMGEVLTSSFSASSLVLIRNQTDTALVLVHYAW